MKGVHQKGLLLEAMMICLFQTVCGSEVVRFKGLSYVMTTKQFVELYKETTHKLSAGFDIAVCRLNSNKLCLIGWASNGRTDLDNSISHYCGIKDGMLFDGTKEPVAVTIENLGNFLWDGSDKIKSLYLEAKSVENA